MISPSLSAAASSATALPPRPQGLQGHLRQEVLRRPKTPQTPQITTPSRGRGRRPTGNNSKTGGIIHGAHLRYLQGGCLSCMSLSQRMECDDLADPSCAGFPPLGLGFGVSSGSPVSQTRLEAASPKVGALFWGMRHLAALSQDSRWCARDQRCKQRRCALIHAVLELMLDIARELSSASTSTPSASTPTPPPPSPQPPSSTATISPNPPATSPSPCTNADAHRFCPVARLPTQGAKRKNAGI